MTFDRHGNDLDNCGNCGGGDKAEGLQDYVKCDTPGKNCGLTMKVSEVCENYSSLVELVLDKKEEVN